MVVRQRLYRVLVESTDVGRDIAQAGQRRADVGGRDAVRRAADDGAAGPPVVEPRVRREPVVPVISEAPLATDLDPTLPCSPNQALDRS